MKTLLVSAIFFCFLFVGSSAAVELPPHFFEEEGNTVLKTFLIKGESEGVRADFKAWIDGKNSFLLINTSGQLELFIMGDELLNISELQPRFSFGMTGHKSTIKSLIFRSSGEDLEYFASRNYFVGDTVEGSYFVSGNANSFSSFPRLSYDYLVEYVGHLMLRTDESGTEGDNGGILGWLLSFWEKLLEFVVKIFIPEAGYFDSWFLEIKTKFSEKTGGLTAGFDAVGTLFEELKSGKYAESKLILEVPDNLLFQGYEGISVNLLSHSGYWLAWLRTVFNGILVLVTSIICFRKLIALIQH